MSKTNSVVAAPAGGRPILAFTGERRKAHFQVLVHGESVELSRVALNLLIDLVIARATAAMGYLRFRPVSVCRLRQAIDDALGVGAGGELIETGGTQEYRLTISMKDLNEQMHLFPAFLGLVAIGIVSTARAFELKRHCKLVEFP
jgi:hypothetical protein